MSEQDEAEFERKRKHLNLALRELAWHEMDARYLALKMDDAPDGTPKVCLTLCGAV